MFKYTKKEKGAVSVFLVIILVPCMLVASIFVDVGRVSLSKSAAESASDLALNSLMTNYDFDLNDWYGMVASCQNIDEFYEASEKCFESALKSQNLSDDEITTLLGSFKSMIGDTADAVDYLQVTPASDDNFATIGAMEGANLANSTMLKSQIVDFMKYRAPLAACENIVDRLRSGKVDGVEDMMDSDKNEPVVKAKQHFCEAESTLMRDSYYTYKQLRDKYSYGEPEPTNELLNECLTAMLIHREMYREMNTYLVTNLYNTEDLHIFNRATARYDDYSYDKSNSECHSRIEDDGTYYIDGDKLSGQFDDVKDAIADFNEAKDNFTEAVNGNGVTYTAGTTNDIQYWKHAQDTYDGSGKYRENLNKAATEVIKQYCILEAMMDCEPGTGLPDNYSDTYEDLKTKVINIRSKYLDTSSHDSSDSYLVLVERLEKISADNIYNIEPDSLTLSDGKTVTTEIADISSDLIGRRTILKEYSDAINIAIYGDGDDIKSLETLKKDASEYSTELSKWRNTANGSGTQMGKDDKAEADEKLSSEEAGNITEESICVLETRLKNIKSQIDSVIEAIDNFTYGGKNVMLITDFSTFKSAASSEMSESEINSRTTQSELESYATGAFENLFKPSGGRDDVIMEINTDDDYNLQLNLEDETVNVPGVYLFWNSKFQGASEDDIDKFDNDRGNAEDKAEKLENSAKNKENPHGDSQDITAEIDTIKEYFGMSSILTGLLGVIGNIVDGEFDDIRDKLYISTYMLEMFSYSTMDNEGRYQMLKKSGYDMSSLCRSNYETAYNTMNDKWNSEEIKDNYNSNKTLTNKLMNSENNAAYGCELEYILYGGTNDDNVKSAYGQIYMIRYTLNLISAFQNFWSGTSNTAATFTTIASGIQTATMGVVPAPIVKVVLIALITAFETANDSNRLEAGFPVEIYKVKATDWQISFEFGGSGDGISGVQDTFTKKIGNFTNSCENGITYSDYLCLFILIGMQDNKLAESMTLRCGDLIQTNMGKVTGSDSYKLENSKTYFTFESTLRVDPLLITLPIFSGYNDAYDTTSTDWCTYKVKKTRGY